MDRTPLVYYGVKCWPCEINYEVGWCLDAWPYVGIAQLLWWMNASNVDLKCGMSHTQCLPREIFVVIFLFLYFYARIRWIKLHK
jgi:hypothetical protein